MLQETRLPEYIRTRLRLPIIAAPMLHISGPELVSAACIAGVMGAFPAANAKSSEELDAWFRTIKDNLRRHADQTGARPAPFCPNLIVRHNRFLKDLAIAAKHGSELVITSVGSPKDAIAPIHDAGGLVFADIASIRHAEKAIKDGVDGLVLLTAGAGGQTGWANGLAFARAVRNIFDGPIAIAGGVSDGTSLLAAMALDCELAYMGTRFIATTESRAVPGYKEMLVDSSLDDIQLTSAFTGLPASYLRPSIIRAGFDPQNLDEDVDPTTARLKFGGNAAGDPPQRWRNIWSAGHSVSGVSSVDDTKTVIEQIAAEFHAAQKKFACRAIAENDGAQRTL